MQKNKVFISYSQDKELNKQKLYRLVNLLRNNNVDVIFDEDIPLGERFTDFMELINTCDYVLFLCTPQYKYKADQGLGGVKYEKNIITAELYEKGNEVKFIPILFSGTWKDSMPIWAKGKIGIDYRKESDIELRKLLSHITSSSNKNSKFNNTFIFPYKWKETAKVNSLLEALINKNFSKAETLIKNGMSLKDIDDSTFQRCLYEFLNDYETMEFLIKHKFNKFHFKYISCLDENNYIWGLVARAYVLNRMDIVELLFSVGYDVFEQGQYIVNGEGYLLWKYCFIKIFDKNLMDLLLSYGYDKKLILLHVDDSDFPNLHAANYIKSNPKINWKGYSLKTRWEDVIERPIMPKIGIFTSKEKERKIITEYNQAIENYNEQVRVQKEFIESITNEERELLEEDEKTRALAWTALNEIVKKGYY